MKRPAILALAMLLAGCGERTLTVCADPNNMPFSNRAGEGLENKLAELIAEDLDAELRVVWWSQRRGWMRETLGAAKCDAWMGVPSGLEALATTRPYYRSGYMFVSRADAPLDGLTLDDPRLRELRIGVQLAGDDGANPPPADALARRGLTQRIRGFTLYGDNREADPAAEVVRAVENGEIDVALAWGPLAGWHAARSAVPLRLEPVTPWMDQGRWPMVFDISIGVAKDNQQLRRELDESLTRNRSAVEGIVEAFYVPLAPG
ncbi:MAG TPA: quinoprotein dehydrogenase-associated putative ABC transporter substrate-binding protein [Croceibacterium sp.]|nr:quinoprotein dehydrogenase-associated putative ABC transporter substrate-binding protein [Croceibacterium sp.]